MKKMLLSAAAFAVVAVSAVAVAPTTSEAVPAFARQTGAACLNCHFSAIPRLTAFGRTFRMNAFRDMGEQALIEDDHLSLPAIFNMSFLMKARISSGHTTNGAGVTVASGGAIGGAVGNATQIQFPDETALLFGGRVGEHMGMFVEMGAATVTSANTAGTVTVTQTGAGLAMQMLGYKVAYVVDIDGGLIAVTLGTSDALGLASVFNDPSNAISRNTRGVQTRARAMRATQQHAGATGVGIYGFVADSLYFAVGGTVAAGGASVLNAGVDMDLSPYARLAFAGELAGLDVVAGAWYEDASNPNHKQAAAAVPGTPDGNRKVLGLDLQVQADIGAAQVGFYMPIVLSSKADATSAFAIAASDTKVSGYMPYFNIGFGPVGVRVGYDYAKTTWTAAGTFQTQKDTNVVLGAWYDLAQNFTLDLEYNGSKRTLNGATSQKLNSTTLQIEYVY